MDPDVAPAAEAAAPGGPVPPGGAVTPGGSGRWAVLGMISAGGALGAAARYGIGTVWPHEPAGFAWSTWAVNVSGCFLIGVLMVLISRFDLQQRLIRPFWGVGFLGGYTTFSTATVDVLQAAPATALIYLAATLIGALVAVWVGTALTEALVRPWPSRRPAE